MLMLQFPGNVYLEGKILNLCVILERLEAGGGLNNENARMKVKK